MHMISLIEKCVGVRGKGVCVCVVIKFVVIVLRGDCQLK